MKTDKINPELKNIVLLHGALGTKNDLLPLETLLSQYYNVFRFNFSGHGDSTNTKEPFSIEQFTLDLSEFIKENNINQCYLFGYSMGGYVALNYALQFPQNIEKIVTLGTKFNWNEDFATKQSKFLNAEKLLEKIPAFANYLDAKHQPNDWKQIVSKTALMMQKLGANPLLNETSLPQINLPVLITIGDKDDMVSREESESTAEILANGSFKLVAETPHPIEKVNFATIAEMCIDFFRR